MGIRFQCPGCGHKLNVKSYLAGRRGICPRCSEGLTIPGADAAVDEPEGREALSSSTPVSSTSASPTARVSMQGHRHRPNPGRQSAVASSPADATRASRSQSSTGDEPPTRPVSMLGDSETPAGQKSKNSSERPLSDPPRAQTNGPDEMGSRKPAPDWDDQQSSDSLRAGRVQQRGNPPDASDRGVPGTPPMDRPTPVPAGKKLGRGQGAQDSVNDLGRAFEDLDPASFVLDRPEQSGVDQPSGYFDWIADSPNSVWYVRHANGSQYGPAVGRQMRRWVDEGRVTEGCHVWRDGWPHWRQAADVFPQILGEPEKPVGKTETETIRSGAELLEPAPPRNRWLFPAVLMFLFVVAAIVGGLVYYMLTQMEVIASPADNEPTAPIVDPFATDDDPDADQTNPL